VGRWGRGDGFEGLESRSRIEVSIRGSRIEGLGSRVSNVDSETVILEPRNYSVGNIVF